MNDWGNFGIRAGLRTRDPGSRGGSGQAGLGFGLYFTARPPLAHGGVESATSSGA